MKRVHAKEEVCIGCRLCEVHCAVQHSASRDIFKAFTRESPPPVPRIRVQENGRMFVAVQCLHCPEPPCVYACLSGAMQQDPLTGAVTVDADRCIGCWTCILVCPYGAIRRDLPRHIIAKCDLCPHLEVPACVANCPNEALVFAEDGASA
jgi:carbon-monoxide dehydrogenase iron sulfur subunit